MIAAMVGYTMAGVMVRMILVNVYLFLNSICLGLLRISQKREPHDANFVVSLIHSSYCL